MHGTHQQIPMTLEKTEGAIKNGQSRDTGNIEHTRHMTQTNKTNTTQKTKKMSNTDPIKNQVLAKDKWCVPIIRRLAMFIT